MHRLFSLPVILFISITSAAAQQSTNTSSQFAPDPVTIYYQGLGEQSPLYNGREYVDYAATIQVGHPFYNTTEFVKGTIRFDGMIFEDAKILYDIIKDKVIVLHYNNVFKIDLLVEKVTAFTLLDHHFIHLFPDSAKVIEEGFYDRLYQGKTNLFVKRKKTIREERSGTDIMNVVDEKNIFFIQKQGAYYPVKNIGGLLDVFSDRREQIRQHLKKNGIKFRKNREAAILLAVQYYDRLSN